ncbi:MAG: hypothetical protein M1298_00375 [Chloroflexi bacterium]|nr:hypothetical protein [Chloroflexota bacterium]
MTVILTAKLQELLNWAAAGRFITSGMLGVVASRHEAAISEQLLAPVA